MINGNKIKHKESEKLKNEVEEFLAKGGKIKDPNKTKQLFSAPRKPANRHDLEYIKASKQRQAVQVPILVEYSKWGGHEKWNKLSKAIGGKVSSSQLSNTCSGKTSVADLSVWREIVAAIEVLRGSK